MQKALFTSIFGFTIVYLQTLIKYRLPALIALLLTQTAAAQLCSGSLGDPVVNVTFGSGSNLLGPPPTALITNYIYTGQSCPADGSYIITNNTTGCFNGTWHTLLEDHTPGDQNGYMMLVNASFNPGVFYLDTVKNLCGGTTYEFSAWLISVLRPFACMGNGNKPNISFSIETVKGDVIQTYNTGDIPNISSPQWNQYGFYFTLPAGFSQLVLRMVNNAPGGCGNDLALDDITFRPCGPKLQAAFVNVNANNDTVDYCITDKKNITINGTLQNGYNNPVIQWQESTDSAKTWKDIPGVTGTSYNRTYATAGRFQYRMTAAEMGNLGLSECRVASNVLTINIDAIPVPMAANSSPACVNAPLKLVAKSGHFYSWTGPNGFTSSEESPVIAAVNLANAGEYYVLATTRGGCSNTDSTKVIVIAAPPADAGNNTTICEGQQTLLQASGGILYRWDAATTLSDTTIYNPVATPLTTTTYFVTAINAFLCKARDSVLITVLKSPASNAGPDQKIMEGETAQLKGTAGGAMASFFWTPLQYINNNTTADPVVSPPRDITYTLHVVANNGCPEASDEVFIRVLNKIAVPNAFSPNGDGINDSWNISMLYTYPESETNVFNRYGQVVFHTQGYNKPWDGRYNGNPVPVGTYYYTINRKNGLPVMSGWLLVIR